MSSQIGPNLGEIDEIRAKHDQLVTETTQKLTKFKQFLLKLTHQQRIAVKYPCFLTCEQLHPRFRSIHTNPYATFITSLDCSWETKKLRLNRPAWVCSAANMPDAFLKEYKLEPQNREALRYLALEQLDGRGSALHGQLVDWTGQALIIHRCVSDEELEFVPAIRDILNTQEAVERYIMVKRHLPEWWVDAT